MHGALREYIAFAKRAVEIELNSASDNPLVSAADQTILSNGNFHPMVLAIAFDALRVAVAHVGVLSERRMSHLWDAVFKLITGSGDLTPDGGPPPPMLGLHLRYPAAAVLPELKLLAMPATLDAPSVDMGVEDHATSAPLAVRKTDEALSLLDDILVIELFLARDLRLISRNAATLGLGTSQALQAVEDVVAGHERSPEAAHRALRDRLADRRGNG